MVAYRHTVAVTGPGKFPLDMLRHDSLAPADSEAVKALAADRGTAAPREPVKLYRLAGKDWKPTAGRWESFRWNVVSHQVEPY